MCTSGISTTSRRRAAAVVDRLHRASIERVNVYWLKPGIIFRPLVNSADRKEPCSHGRSIRNSIQRLKKKHAVAVRGPVAPLASRNRRRGRCRARSARMSCRPVPSHRKRPLPCVVWRLSTKKVIGCGVLHREHGDAVIQLRTPRPYRGYVPVLLRRHTASTQRRC